MCVFGPGATADHLIQVRLVDQISYTTREITVEGRLKPISHFVGSDGKRGPFFFARCRACDGQTMNRRYNKRHYFQVFPWVTQVF